MTLSVPSLDERKLQSETVAFRVENFFGEKYELARVPKWHQTKPCSPDLASTGVKLNKKVRLGVLHRTQKEKHAYQSTPASESTFSPIFRAPWLLEEQRKRSWASIASRDLPAPAVFRARGILCLMSRTSHPTPGPAPPLRRAPRPF